MATQTVKKPGPVYVYGPLTTPKVEENAGSDPTKRTP